MSVTFPISERKEWAGYQLKTLRGTGAFGHVWEAEDAHGASVAFKVVEGGAGVAVPEIRNIHTIAQFNHPHIMRVEKVWCEHNRLIVVMELGDGSLQDLADVSQIEFGVPMPANVASDYCHQAAEAIDFLNAREHNIGGLRVGIQHRDVKPNNLMLFGEQVKLGDFGLSTVIAAPSVRQASAGTPAYAAPEVFRGELSDWTDQYALAVTYCKLRSGRFPFQDTPTSFPRDYKRSAPDLSMLDAGERPIIARALSSTPRERWSSCQEMTRQLLALAPRPREPGLSDRRLEDRRNCPHRPRIRLQIPATRMAFLANLVNISACGMGLFLDHPLSIRTDFVFSVVAGRGTEPRELSAHIVRRMAQPDGRWFVGCRLTAPFTTSEYNALLGIEQPTDSPS